jgi:hypothetical protein
LAKRYERGGLKNMSLRKGVIVCAMSLILALLYQVFVVWIMLDNYAAPIWEMTDVGPDNAVFDFFPIAQQMTSLVRYLGIAIALGGFIYLAVSPFIRESTGGLEYYR